MRAMTRAWLLLLLTCLAGAAPPDPGEPANFYPFHVRVSLGGERLVDRIMVKTDRPWGEVYQREWSSFAADPCAAGTGGISRSRRLSVALGNPPEAVRDRSYGRYPPHAFNLQVDASLPIPQRSACDGFVAFGTARLSQIVILDPGRSITIAGSNGLVVEIERR
jgi:hypothetical protein